MKKMAAMDQDGFLSSLPQELIHYIFGLLGSTKEVIKASAISKSFLAAWFSYPVLDLDDSEFLNEELEFHKFVDETMTTVSNRGKGRLQSFKLWIDLLDIKKETSLVNKWIGVALDCQVPNMSLKILRSNWLYSVPGRVLSNNSLKSLVLFSGKITTSPNKSIDLPCLQSLELSLTSIDEKDLQRLLKGCPLLEKFTIQCPNNGVSKLKISHVNLKMVTVNTDFYNSDNNLVEVEAPCLENFSYIARGCYLIRSNIVVDKSPILKFLDVTLSTVNREWLLGFLSKFTALETLKLELFDRDMEAIKISNPSIKNMVLEYHSENMVEVEIDCPMLCSFKWTYMARGINVDLPSLSVINPQPNLATNLHLHYTFLITCFNKSWFHKLREFLSALGRVTMSLFVLLEPKEEVQDVDDDGLPQSAINIERLNLLVEAPKSYHSFIMNGLLSACHPDTLHLLQPPPGGHNDHDRIF